jgi:hypothetical protein
MTNQDHFLVATPDANLSKAQRSWNATAACPSPWSCCARFHAPSAGPSPTPSRSCPPIPGGKREYAGRGQGLWAAV